MLFLENLVTYYVIGTLKKNDFQIEYHGTDSRKKP